MLIRDNKNRRSGAAMVEMAFVAGIFLLFLFGVLEYSRLIYVQQILENSARVAARYGSANTDISNFETQVRQLAVKQLANEDKNLKNFKVDIYRINAADDGKGNITYNRMSNPANAEFGEFIVVEVKGDFEPVLPEFLLMGQTITLRSRVYMNSEAN